MESTVARQLRAYLQKRHCLEPRLEMEFGKQYRQRQEKQIFMWVEQEGPMLVVVVKEQ